MEAKHPLQEYRESFNPPLKRAALAKALGVARVTVKRWETGDRNIDPELVPSVSEKTGIPREKLRPDLVEKHEKLFGSAA